MISIHLPFSFTPLWIHLHSVSAFYLNFFFFLPSAPAKDDSHPERAGDDEYASPKWLQSIVISGWR